MESDVNVGGPDGLKPGDDPPCTVGSVIVAYQGGDARRWLWERLDEVRDAYEAEWGT